jgi:hypothetical protein
VFKLSSVLAMAEVALRSSAARTLRPLADNAHGPGPFVRAAAARAGVLLRPLPLVLAGVWLLQRSPGAPAEAMAEPDLSVALTLALRAEGLSADAVDVYWVDGPGGIVESRSERPRAVMLARRAGEPADVYVARVKLSPEGRLLKVTGVYNVSETSAVEERQLIAFGERVAWTISGGGKTYSVHFADLRGESTPHGKDWTPVARWQHELTNLQDVGQREGIGRRSFRLDPAANQLTLGFTDRELLIHSDSHKVEVPTDGKRPIRGERFVKAQETEATQPGNLVTWAVDRVRAMPWFGNDRMQAVKAIAFWALDKVENAYGTVTGDDGSKRVAEEMGELLETPATSYTDPETGWPPAPMATMLKPPLKGEGQWVSLERDPFIRQNPGAPNPFVVSFIRTDRERVYSQIYVTMWDARQVRLHAMSGTKEPKSATGEPGPGLVPRNPKVMNRLVGAFNGGFQTTHGDYGMVTDRVVYLPPKPFAATVAEFSSGATLFGTWPREAPLPDDIVSLRQNMTPLVMDGKVNPYRREWWGGVPEGWTDDSRTVRSGLCLTNEKFVAYFYGPSIDANHLASAMHRARCEYGIHLDMNAGHTGLEFYTVAKAAQVPKLGRELDAQWEASGPVPFMDGYGFVGRRMIKYMALMNFPRYIQRDSRDFFYLTLRPLLPGSSVAAAVKAPEAGEGEWNVRGLPQHGWPYAIATTWLSPSAERSESKINVVKLDAKLLKPSTAIRPEDQTVVAFRLPQGSVDGGSTLWWTESGFVIADKPPELTAQRITDGYLPTKPSTRAAAAVGVDDDGMLLYAEVATAAQPDRDGVILEAALRRAGAALVLLCERPLGAAIGGQRDLAGHPVSRTRNAVYFVRKPGPGAGRMFTDTPIVPPHDWFKAQSKPVKVPG